MIINIIETIKISRGNDVICTIPKDMSFSTISLEYISKGIEIYGSVGGFIAQEEISEVEEGFKRKYFIIYFRRLYLAIPKELCYVPVSNGWGYNL